MSASRLACVGLLLQWAMQTCLAGAVQQFGAAPVYSMVDSDGVTLFTNIPPAGAVLAPGLEPAANQGRTRSAPPPANGPASHVTAHAATLPAPAQNGLPAGSGADETALDETPPQMRDGGPPPDDH